MRVPGWQAAPSCPAYEGLGIEPRALRTLGEHDIPSSYLPFFIHASSSYVSILPPPPKPSGLRLVACVPGWRCPDYPTGIQLSLSPKCKPYNSSG